MKSIISLHTDNQRDSIIRPIVDHVMLNVIVEVPALPCVHHYSLIFAAVDDIGISLNRNVKLAVVKVCVPIIIDMRKNSSARRNLGDQYSAKMCRSHLSHETKANRLNGRKLRRRWIPNRKMLGMEKLSVNSGRIVIPDPYIRHGFMRRATRFFPCLVLIP